MITQTTNRNPFNILLVEDNDAEALLCKLAILENIADGKNSPECVINRVENGQAAIDYIKKQSEYKTAITPDLILLDLNLPLKSGKEVLDEIKSDIKLSYIPVVILSNSKNEKDILDCYRLHANSYIAKPLMYDIFVSHISYILNYWNSLVQLPTLRG